MEIKAALKKSVSAAMASIMVITSLASTAHAQSVTARKLNPKSVQSVLSGKADEEINKVVKDLANYFDTVTNEFFTFCQELNAGPECTKWPSLRSSQMISRYEGPLKFLPQISHYRLVEAIRSKVSVNEFRRRYFSEFKSYLTAYAKMTNDLYAIAAPKFREHGYFVSEQNRFGKSIYEFAKPYMEAGVPWTEVGPAFEDITKKSIIAIALTNFFYDRTGKPMSERKRKLNELTKDAVTLKIISTAQTFFKTNGVFEQAEPEISSLLRLAIEFSQTIPLHHGIWTTNAQLASHQNIGSTMPVAKSGKFINLKGIVAIWEMVKKDFVIPMMIAKVSSRPKATFAELTADPDLLQLGSVPDTATVIGQIYFDPLATEIRDNVYNFTYYNRLKSDDQATEYQRRDFIRKSEKSFNTMNARIDELEKRYSIVGDNGATFKIVDRAALKLDEERLKARQEAEKEMKRLKDSATQPSGVDQIKEGAHKLLEFGKTAGISAFLLGRDALKLQKAGTSENQLNLIGKNREFMLRTYGYSFLGNDKEMMSRNAAWQFNNAFWAPLLSLSEMVGGSMLLAEDGWDLEVRYQKGMTKEQYEQAEKTDASVKALKWTFYGLQAIVGLGATIALGGAPMAVSASAGTTAATVTLRAAGSILLKRAARRGVWVAKQSIQPLGMAIGLGGLFSVGNEMYTMEKEGWNWNRFLTGVATGASTTLMFMGGINGLARLMKAKGVSAVTIGKVTGGIDVVESSGDVGDTFTKITEAQTLIQKFSVLILVAGNVMDMGDSAGSFVMDAYREGKARKANATQNGTGPNLSEAEVAALSNKERGRYRIELAVRKLGKPLKSKWVKIIRSFAPTTGHAQLVDQLKRAGMPGAEAEMVAGLFNLWRTEFAS